MAEEEEALRLAKEQEAQEKLDESWELNTVSSYEEDTQVFVLDEECEVVEKTDTYETYENIDPVKEIFPNLDCQVTKFCIIGDWSLPTLEEMQICNSDMRKIYLGGHTFCGKVKRDGGVCEMIITNNCEVEWPTDTKLRMVCGDGAGIMGPKDAMIGAVSPGEHVGLQFNFAPGAQPSGYSYWILESQGKAFGNCLIFERV